MDADTADRLADALEQRYEDRRTATRRRLGITTPDPAPRRATDPEGDPT